MFEPDWETFFPEFVVYAPVGNSVPIETLVDSGCRILTLWGAKLEKDDTGVWCTDGATTFFGVAHDHLLLGMSQTPEKYRKLEGDGYLANLPGDVQDGLDGGPPVFGYFNVDKAFEVLGAQKDFLLENGWPLEDLPPSLPIQGVTASVDLYESSPETELEQGQTPYDSRVEIQALMSEDGLQEWLANHLESVVVWAESASEEVSGGAATPGTSVQATLQEISDWQRMGAEELGEPYAACGSEEKATALVNGGDPNTVYSDEDRACFENIGWTPAAGNVAFWTEIQGPEASPAGFTVVALETGPAGIQRSSLQHPDPTAGQ